jgi:hypothetical protein
MKLTRKELRDVAISLRLSKSERENLTRLTQHYQTSNADLIAWLLQKELEGVGLIGNASQSGDLPPKRQQEDSHAGVVHRSGSGTTLEQLEERVEALEKAQSQVTGAR